MISWEDEYHSLLVQQNQLSQKLNRYTLYCLLVCRLVGGNFSVSPNNQGKELTTHKPHRYIPLIHLISNQVHIYNFWSWILTPDYFLWISDQVKPQREANKKLLLRKQRRTMDERKLYTNEAKGKKNKKTWNSRTIVLV